jgi:nitroreductase
MCATLTGDQALVVLAAGSAPSLHNTQPWEFSLIDDHLLLCADSDRALWVSDPAGRALYISCGAALFSARSRFARWGTSRECGSYRIRSTR